MRNILVLSLLGAAALFGQSADTPLKLGDVVVTGTFRTRLYAWDWFEPSSGNNQYAYSGNLLRVNFTEKHAGWDWDAELAAPFLLGLPNNATAAAPQGALGLGSNYYSANSNSQYSGMVFPKQLFVRFKGLGPSEAGSLQIGRFEFNDGSELVHKNATLATLKRDRISQRLSGTFGWSDVGRSFDGVHYSYSKPATDFTFVAALPTRGVYQTDGWGGIASDSAMALSRATGVMGITRPIRGSSCSITTIGGTSLRPTIVRRRSARTIRIIFASRPSAHTACTRSRPRREPSTPLPGEPCRPADGEHKPSWPMLSISKAASNPRCFPG